MSSDSKTNYSENFYLKKFNDSSTKCEDNEIGGPNCPIYTGTVAVYRFSTAMVLFFLSFMLITLGVSTSQTIRARVHNGFVIANFYNNSKKFPKSRNFRSYSIQLIKTFFNKILAMEIGLHVITNIIVL